MNSYAAALDTSYITSGGVCGTAGHIPDILMKGSFIHPEIFMMTSMAPLDNALGHDAAKYYSVHNNDLDIEKYCLGDYRVSIIMTGH